mgnify:CR=1 FL=1
MLFDEKWYLGRPRFDLFSHFGRFLRVLKITFFFDAFLGRQEIRKNATLERPWVAM